jgi:hypothetical protein
MKLQRVTKRAFSRHVQRTRMKLADGANSRQWWHLTKHLSGVSTRASRIAPDVKALADFFESKFVSDDVDSSASCSDESVDVINSIRLKKSLVSKVLRSLDASKSVGPDNVSPRVLKIAKLLIQ